MQSWRGLYEDTLTDGEEPDEPVVGRNRCTPDLLLGFVRDLGRTPTLAECKAKFGGILGPMLDAWTLQKEGRWPRKMKKKLE